MAEGEALMNGGWTQETVVHRVHLWICLPAQPCMPCGLPSGVCSLPTTLYNRGTLQSPRKPAEREDHNLASGPLPDLPGAVSARAESPPLL